MTGATAALGIAAASFGGDGEDEGGDGGAKIELHPKSWTKKQKGVQFIYEISI